MKRYMNRLWKRDLARVTVLVILTVFGPTLSAAPNKTEDELIEMLKSRDQQKVVDALDRLPKWYPKSTKAIPQIKELLKSKDVGGARPKVAPNFLARRAARALGE